MEETADWRLTLSDSITTLKQLGDHLSIDVAELAPVIERYPMRIPRAFFGLIRKENDPIWRQVVPNAAELGGTLKDGDPLNESGQSPLPGLIHRYPDRVILAVSNHCAAYCRFCMRKRHAGREPSLSMESFDRCMAYIRNCSDISEVILSGGDPLMLADNKLGQILKALKKITHVKILRTHTRMPGTLPARITANLVELLKNHQPLFVMVHFNHPRELSASAVKALAHLADAGIPLGSQTVLLKGVNDSPDVMSALMRKLVQNRVKPYYLHHPDLIRGTDHLRCSISGGMNIMDKLRGHLSGLCVPQYMLDLPGGGGKVPLLPGYIVRQKNDILTVKNYCGDTYHYPLS
jgi:lysine 2,3-aminomutase